MDNISLPLSPASSLQLRFHHLAKESRLRHALLFLSWTASLTGCFVSPNPLSLSYEVAACAITEVRSARLLMINSPGHYGSFPRYGTRST